LGTLLDPETCEVTNFKQANAKVSARQPCWKKTYFDMK